MAYTWGAPSDHHLLGMILPAEIPIPRKVGKVPVFAGKAVGFGCLAPPAIAALNLSHHFVVDLANNEASEEIHGKSDLAAQPLGVQVDH